MYLWVYMHIHFLDKLCITRNFYYLLRIVARTNDAYLLTNLYEKEGKNTIL